ncbi:septal ring lytic transglycosylase RlpA family protein [Nitrosomonas oligotropha]|uniref:Endolytic peptidoglycan transglycosylase RlpA n=1 Tax=Nitrosomonas oligotropha TaxID=42354 RepID=A0A1H8N191_9PROT|nr:septal ring lytic transglycosylase RlpA family protein [Nitrosomonas oligotropha]SDW56145.1 rare lipoprotein A [Nitrosomonas oligotropha]SEO23286.1 rare lipoprotein A [Nitrosomonas oligotropha]
MTNLYSRFHKAHHYLSARTAPSAGMASVMVLALLTACSTTPQYQGTAASKQKNKWVASIPDSGKSSGPAARKGGGYYLDDGPEDNPPDDLHLVPDAVPRAEPLRQANMQPYVALGKNFKPMTELKSYKKRGIASWYGRRYHGNNTASGEVYDMYAMTAAHPTLPLPSYARVTNLDNGKSVIVRLNDRGPFLSDRLIDLSYTAAYKLGILAGGSGHVEVESIVPEGSAALASARPSASLPATDSDAVMNMVYLQLGAFGSSDNAHNFLTQVRQKLPSLKDAVSITKNNGLYKIHAGPYPDQTVAKLAANTISQQMAITPVLVTD